MTGKLAAGMGKFVIAQVVAPQFGHQIHPSVAGLLWDAALTVLDHLTCIFPLL